MNHIGFAFALVVSAFFLLGCVTPPSSPPVPGSPQPSAPAPPPVQPIAQPQTAAPAISLEPIQAKYAPGEVTMRCDAAIAKVNASLNEIAARPAGQRGNALLDFEKAMADYYDEVGPLDFTGYVYPDAGISAEGAACEEKVGRFGSVVMTRKDIYNAVKEFTPKNQAEARLYDRTITTFELNGLALPDDKLAQVREMKQNLSTITSKFSQNLNLDSKTIELTAAELEGAQPDFLSRLAKTQDGKHIVTMKYPDYYGVMENAKSSETRRKMSLAFNNRGSPEENTLLLGEAIVLRQKLASALGFATWADYVTSMRMAKNASNVEAFLSVLEQPLANKSREDISGLLAFKKTLEPSATSVDSWDVLYLEVQLKKDKYSLDNEKVREYFPLSSVMSGMFSTYSSLFNVSFQKVEGAKVWSPDVQLYRVADASTNATISYIYFDLFPREGKYGHEAMSPLIMGREKNGSYAAPVAAIIANKNPPADGKPALLAHDEVVDLFHEFGHALHATLTTVPYASLAGTNVAWDFVETPSQTLQNWPWEPSIITELSGHYLDPSQKIPSDMRDKLIATRNLDQGYTYARQLAQAKIDMDYHTASGPVDVNAVSNAEMERITGMKPIAGNSFPATFGHIMSGYDAGYYSYMWSEAYSLDCFSQFQAEGLSNTTTGVRFRNTILAQGDMKDGDALLREFLGRDANSDAFFRKLNISRLQIYPEDFPPYNYLDASGKVTGKSTIVVRELLSRLSQSADITLGTLSDGYSRALSGPNVAIYSLGRTAEREPLFKWVGPIGEWELTLYAKSGSALASGFSAAGNDAAKTALAKAAPSICVVKDDVRHQYLLAQNFSNIVAVGADSVCAQKLASGEASLWFGSSTSFSQIVAEANLAPSSFAPVQSVQKNALYIAFSRDVPDSTVAAWQAALDAMKADGSFARISAQ